MAVAKRQDPWRDWCHVCGGRSFENAEVWYPENAEHDELANPRHIHGNGASYLRICSRCLETLHKIASGVEPIGEDGAVVLDRRGKRLTCYLCKKPIPYDKEHFQGPNYTLPCHKKCLMKPAGGAA